MSPNLPFQVAAPSDHRDFVIVQRLLRRDYNIHISLSSPCFHCLSSPPAPVVNLSRKSGLHLRHAGAFT
ncbi:MAG: hypothetical protein VX007_06125, partial [Pseudomonadota bacterium]|nr:hypothetical protein [Pseudomonadota bacterium]